MKTILIGILILLSFFFAGYSQSIINTGCVLYISDGSTLTFVSDYEDTGNGEIRNNGDLDLYGDWINNGNGSALATGYSGRTNFNGIELQQIGGDESTEFENLEINNDVQLLVDTYVSNIMNLNSGQCILDDNTLFYQGFADIGYSENYYFVTEGAGSLNRFVDMTMPATFPIGTAFSFAPVIIANNIASGTFSVNILSDVLTSGGNGNTIPEIDNCVALSWYVQPDFQDIIDYNLQLQWNETNEGNSFDRNHSAIGMFLEGAWIANPPSQASGNDPYQHILENISHAGYFAVGDMDSPMSFELEMTLDLKVFLEGPFNGSDMDNSLHSTGMIPLVQPFSVEPWNYTGEEAVAEVPEQVVDWVLVETRDAYGVESAGLSSILERKAAFLLTDGRVVDMDGSGNVLFSIEPQENLYVVIYHRNHLSIISAQPLTFADGHYAYDFTLGGEQAYSDTQDGQKELMGGYYGMFSGDGSGGGQISHYDRLNIWMPQAGEKGYLQADYQLDGQVNNVDKNDHWQVNLGKSSQVPE